MIPKIKYVALTCLLIFFCMQKVNAQEIGKEVFNYLSNDVIKNNIFALQKVPNISIEDLVSSKINELRLLSNFFKYHTELENGNFIIEIENDRVYLKMFAKADIPQNTFFNKLDIANKSINDSKFKGIVIFKIIRTDEYVNLEMQDFNSNINLDGFMSNLNNNILDTPTPIIFNWQPAVIIDKQILNNLSNYVTGKILNKSITTSKMRGTDNQPCQLYNDLTAGTIIPFDGGTRAKVLTIDKIWNRIVSWDKDRNYCPPPCINFNGPLSNFNPQSSYTLNYPTDITFGTYLVSNNGWNYGNNIGRDTIYPLFIADNHNNRIIKVNYLIRTRFAQNLTFHEYTIDDASFAEVKNNIYKPYTLGFHSGNNSQPGYTSDDILWYSEGIGINKPLVCINPYNGQEQQRISQVIYQNEIFDFDADRISIYRSPDGLRNVMAFIDKRRNYLFCLKLNTDGKFNSNTPIAFSALNFNYQILSSLMLTSNNTGFDGTTLWAVTDGGTGGCEGGNNCGYIHTMKILYVGNNPVYTDYLSSYWMGLNSDKSFVNLNNLHVQNGYVDIFTMEKWNEQYGMRRFKPGIGVISDNAGDYCVESNYMNISLRLSNPAKVKITTEHRTSGNSWNYKNYTVNGYELPDGIMNLPSGNSSLNISVNYFTDNPSPENEVRISLLIAPQDEDPNNSPNKIIKQYIRLISSCYSGGGGCPYVYIFDGDSLRQDNNILHRSEFSTFINQDITDKYKLNVYPKFSQVDSTCLLQFRELDNDRSYLDNVSLKAIDHPIGTEITITENNDIVLYFPHVIVNPSVGLLNDSNITCNLFYDSTCINLLGDSSDVLNTGFYSIQPMTKINILNKIRFTLNKVLSINYKSNKKTNNQFSGSNDEIQDSLAVLFDPQNDRISVPYPSKDWAGQLVGFNSSLNYNSGYKLFARRENRSVISVPLAKNIFIDSISTEWFRNFDLTFFITSPVYYGGYIEHDLQFYNAVSFSKGDVSLQLGSKDNDYAILDNTDVIDVKFKNTESMLMGGMVRDYVLITNGRYDKIIGDLQVAKKIIDNNFPKVFQLHQNYPNPFNPVTSIKYDLPKDVFVSIKVYDLLGKAVKTLVNEFKKVGYYEISFDGSNLASGVYFYRIEAANFVVSKKMILVK